MSYNCPIPLYYNCSIIVLYLSYNWPAFGRAVLARWPSGPGWPGLGWARYTLMPYSPVLFDALMVDPCCSPASGPLVGISAPPPQPARGARACKNKGESKQERLYPMTGPTLYDCLLRAYDITLHCARQILRREKRVGPHTEKSSLEKQLHQIGTSTIDGGRGAGSRDEAEDNQP